MFASQSFSSSSVAFVGLLFLVGCGVPELDVESEHTSASSTDNRPKTTEQPSVKAEAEPDTDKSSDNGTSLMEVFEAWESGAKDEAVSKLLRIDWESPTAIGDIPIMSITEEDFVALSRSEKGEQQAMAIELTNNSGAILSHAFSLAEQAEGEGDHAKAKLYYEAVSRLGNDLTGPERLTFLQMMGKVLVQKAEEKLAAQK